MQKLENRIEALERQTATRNDLTVFIKFVSPGPNGPIEDDPIAYVGDVGERWDRLPGETLRQLKDRAGREVKRGPFGFARLRECYAGDKEAVRSAGESKPANRTMI
jgi:hypothetical protein